MIRDIEKRLRRAETQLSASGSTCFRHFMAQGPVGFDAETFLRSCGHDLGGNVIISVIVGAKDGKPIDLPLKDLTRQREAS